MIEPKPVYKTMLKRTSYAAACYEQYSLTELETFFENGPSDGPDRRIWHMTKTQWWDQMRAALIEKLSDQYIHVDKKTLRDVVIWVEENNKMNERTWADWGNPDLIAEAYGIEISPEESTILARAIASNGESLKLDIPAVGRADPDKRIFKSSAFDRL